MAKLKEQLGRIGIDILKVDIEAFKNLIDGDVTNIAEFKGAARSLVDNHFKNINEIHQANNPQPADSSKDGFESDDDDIIIDNGSDTSFHSNNGDIRGKAEALHNHGLLANKGQVGIPVETYDKEINLDFK